MNQKFPQSIMFENENMNENQYCGHLVQTYHNILEDFNFLANIDESSYNIVWVEHLISPRNNKQGEKTRVHDMVLLNDIDGLRGALWYTRSVWSLLNQPSSSGAGTSKIMPRCKYFGTWNLDPEFKRVGKDL